MAPRVDDSYRLLGAETLLKHAQSLAKEVEGVRAAKDIEAIHRMRVASRRMRSALELFAVCFAPKTLRSWRKAVRRVTRALGAARDLDVQIDWVANFLEGVTASQLRPGIRRLLLRLRQERQRLQADVVDSIDRLESGRVLREMGRVLQRVRALARLRRVADSSPFVFQQAFQALSERLEELVAFEPYVEQPERKDEHHAMRLATKRLRYSLETFEHLYDGNLKEPLGVARETQDLLGELHDCDVWVEHLPDFLDAERQRTLSYCGTARPFGRLRAGILHLQEDRQARRVQVHQNFVHFWRQVQEKDVWERTIEVLRMRLAPAELSGLDGSAEA